MGINDVCPPLAKWSDWSDGTYNLHDCLTFHLIMDQQHQWYNRAMAQYG